MNRIQHILDKAVQGNRLAYDEGFACSTAKI